MHKAQKCDCHKQTSPRGIFAPPPCQWEFDEKANFLPLDINKQSSEGEDDFGPKYAEKSAIINTVSPRSILVQVISLNLFQHT